MMYMYMYMYMCTCTCALVIGNVDWHFYSLQETLKIAEELFSSIDKKKVSACVCQLFLMPCMPTVQYSLRSEITIHDLHVHVHV